MRWLALALLLPFAAEAQRRPYNPSVSPQITSTVASGGDGLRLVQGVGVCFNSTTCTTRISYDGTDFIIDVPASKGFQIEVNGTDVLTVSSTGLVTSAVAQGSSAIIMPGRLCLVANCGARVSSEAGSGAVEIRGNRIDGSGGTDVIIKSTGTRTAGLILDVMESDGGASLFKVAHDGVVTAAGGARLNTAATAAPTCNSAARGTIHYTPGGAGVADVVQICSKSSGDVYAWRDLATPET